MFPRSGGNAGALGGEQALLCSLYLTSPRENCPDRFDAASQERMLKPPGTQVLVSSKGGDDRSQRRSCWGDDAVGILFCAGFCRSSDFATDGHHVPAASSRVSSLC